MIHAEFMREVASFTNAKISKVVLNGSYEIRDFMIKYVDENVVVMNYFIPFGSVSTIELIELQDDSGRVICSNTVNVPLASDTIMVQTIEVKEG